MSLGAAASISQTNVSVIELLFVQVSL